MLADVQRDLIAPSSPGMPATMSKKGFAELIGVSPGRVSQMIAAGLPLQPNGRVDVAAGRAWVQDNVDPNRRRAALDGPVPGNTPISPRGAREVAEAEIARLKADKLAGALIDRKAALRAVETRARAERDAWIGWVNRAAPEIAAATGAEIADVVAVLDRLVRDQLATLAGQTIEQLTR
jgi:hypothetical protein